MHSVEMRLNGIRIGILLERRYRGDGGPGWNPEELREVEVWENRRGRRERMEKLRDEENLAGKDLSGGDSLGLLRGNLCLKKKK